MLIRDGRQSFYQWDLNQQITSTSLKVGDEIHFFNSKQPTALVVIAYELDGKVVADVPNILLQSSQPIAVYRYITNGETAHTVEEYRFNVIQRARPDDYIYTETEVLTYKALDERITKLENGGGTPSVEITVDQTYDATSENAQSGKAVAEAIEINRDTVDNIMYDSSIGTSPIRSVLDMVFRNAGEISRLRESIERLDNELGNIDIALDEIIAFQESLIGGAE